MTTPTTSASGQPCAVPVFRTKLVRERDHEYRADSFDSADRASAALRTYIEDDDREHFVVAMLDVKLGLVGIHTAHIGTINQSIVGPSEVFRAAILAGADAVILAHNHPSGDPEPSPEDVAVTKKLAAIGDLLGIRVLDHLVVGSHGRFVSLSKRGLLK